MTELPLASGARGPAVKDVQQRLAALGHSTDADEPGVFGPATEAAVRAFQDRRGLRVDGICGEQTWAGLVEAGYALGDRWLYQTAPMLRGDDVGVLQRAQLNIGFKEWDRWWQADPEVRAEILGHAIVPPKKPARRPAKSRA